MTDTATVWSGRLHRQSQDPTHELERIPTSHSGHGSRSIYAANEPFPEPQDTTFDPAHPRVWQSPAIAFSDKIYRQLLGLNPFKTTYLSLYDSLNTWSNRLIALGGAVCAVAAGVPLPVIGLIFGKIINEFPPDEHTLTVRISQLLGVAAAYFVVTALYTIAFGLTSEKISTRLRERLLDCLLHLDQAYLDTHDVDVNALLTEKMDTIQAGCSEKVGIFIQSMSYFVAAFTVGFILNAKLTGILLASVVPAITLTFVFLSPAVSRYSRAASEFSEQANNIVENALGAVKIVQAFDMIEALCQKHSILLDSSIRTNVRKAIFAAAQTALVYFIAYSANALAFYLGSKFAAGGNAGTVYAVVFLIIDASFVVGQFAPFLEIFARAAAAKGVVQDLFEARTAGASSGTYRHSDYKPDLHGQDVELSDVNFSYPARPSVKALNSVKLKFRAGTFTALVGTSGGGKSTIVALLLGIYNYSGRIKFGESDLRSIDSSYLRSHIAVLDQDSVLFTGTIFDNVCYGLIGEKLSAEEKAARCDEALKAAAVDFLNELPQGLSTRIGNEVQLSGGQKQRICLARALIKKPAVLILDEPTSDLDARSEVLVMDAVKKVAAAGTTVIMVAHRLSTVLDVDHVAVLAEGTVVEQGAPLELSENGTVFRSLLNAQNTTLDSRRPSMDASMLLKHKHEEPERLSMSSDDELSGGVNDDPPEAIAAFSSWMLIRRIASIVKPDFWFVLWGVAASVITGGLLLGESIVFGNLVQLLNNGTSFPGYRSQADFFCLMFFVLACIALVSYVTSGSTFGITSTRLTARLQSRVLHRLLHLDMQWFSSPGHSVHELMGAFTKDPGDLSSLSGIALGTVFTILTSVCGGIILAHVVAWKIAIVLLSAVPVMILAGYTRLRILTISEVRHRAAYSGATSLAAESCRNRRTVTALCLEKHLIEEYKIAIQQPYHQLRHFTIYANTLLAFCFAITYFVYALAYWWGSKQVRNGSYSEKDFFTVLPALLFSAQSAGQLFSLSPEIARAKTAARSIFALMSARSSIMTMREHVRYQHDKLSTRTSTEKSILTKSSENAPKLQFCNVSLSYPGNASKKSLRDVDFSVSAGKTVAFVGPSGAGKSSTISLIERFFDPTAGSILYDGHDIRQIDVRILRSAMGLVSQEPDLFSGSITYNVKLGAAPGKEVTDSDVVDACRRCGLHDFISSLPDGYNTECGSSGSSKLSGGQRQRLAIARALVRDPEILLLDEPTSALDAHSEATVQEALAEAAKGRTTIIVAHRLASIRHVDTILVFDRGKLVAEGTHAELMEAGGLYASMAQAQSLA